MIRIYLKHLTLLAGLLVSSATLAASASDASSIKLSTILQKLAAQGYTNTYDIEREQGILRIEGINKEGIHYEVQVDPMTGNILKKQYHVKTRFSALDIAEKLETKGYKQIDEIEFDDGVYKVEAIDAAQKKVDLYIDPNTGETTAQD